MAKSTSKLSKYELERLERIKENEKMLEELFPEGANAVLAEVKRNKRAKEKEYANSRGSESGASSEEPGNSDEEKSPRKRNRFLVK